MGGDIGFQQMSKVQIGGPVRACRLWPMVLCNLMWLVVICAGLYGNMADPQPIPRRVKHPLVVFDRLFRKAGPFMPFTVVLPRMLMPNTGRVTSPGAATFLVYVLITAARILLYLLIDAFAPKSLADHILLGSSVYAILSVEVAILLKQMADIGKVKTDEECSDDDEDGDLCGVGDRAVARSQPSGHSPLTRVIQLGRLVVLVLTITLAAAVLGDMYFTARYFHTFHETIVTAAAGMIIFQVPLAAWSFNTRVQ